MKRRTFFKAAACAGLMVMAPKLIRNSAAAGGFQGPFWVFVSATGGWDPCFLFDPTLDPEFNRVYTSIGTIGNISYANYAIDLAAFNLSTTSGYEEFLLSNEQFLGLYGSRLTVINGLDTTTNNHETGRRTVFSGSMESNAPALAAMIAAYHAPDSPMSFLSGGGYDYTDGIIPLTRVNNTNALLKIQKPNTIDANQEELRYYHTAATMDRIKSAQLERLMAARSGQRLPKLQAAQDTLFLARASENSLDALEVPELVDLPGNQLNDLEGMMRQTQLACAAFKAGIAVSASVHLGGFDTHGNHNRDQRRQLAKLLGGIHFLMEEIKAQGLDGSVNVVIGSDFARGPHYNSENNSAGKDHFQVTSLCAMGPSIAGDRVVGATDDRRLAKKLDADTLAVVDGDGLLLSTGHVHRALRSLAGLDGSEVAARYPLGAELLPVFG